MFHRQLCQIEELLVQNVGEDLGGLPEFFGYAHIPRTLKRPVFAAKRGVCEQVIDPFRLRRNVLSQHIEVVFLYPISAASNDETFCIEVDIESGIAALFSAG